jgi:hypothetical protein
LRELVCGGHAVHSTPKPARELFLHGGAGGDIRKVELSVHAEQSAQRVGVSPLGK